MKNTLMALSLVLGLGYATAQQTTPAQKKSEPAKKEMKGHETAKKVEKNAKGYWYLNDYDIIEYYN